MKKLIPLSLLCLVTAHLFAQVSTKGTSFWLAYMENVSLIFNGTPDFGVVISSETDAEGIISVPATGLEIPFTVSAGEVEEFLLPEATWYSQVSETVENKGILIESNVPVEVNAMHYRIYFSDGAKLLPEELLSDSYLVLAAADLNNTSPSSIVILATQDNTEVQITPSTLTQGLRPPGVTFTQVLNRGQIYQIHASADLSGTLIESSNGEPLAVFAGAQQADIYCISDDSHLWEQVFPQELWGSDYLLLPYEGMSGDVFKVLAGEDQTVLSLNCEEVATIDSGQSFEIFSDEVSRLVSSKPVQVAQLNTGQNCNASSGGPSFVILPPLQRQGDQFRWYASQTTAYFSEHWVHLVTRTTNDAEILLDGTSVSLIESGVYPGYSYARVNVEPGNHELVGNQNFWSTVAGFGEFDAYSFALGWSDKTEGGTVNLSAIPGPTGSDFCVGETVFFVYEAEIPLSNEVWDFGNEQSGNGPDPTMIFDEAGTYTVTFQGFDENDCPYFGSFDIEIIECEINSVSRATEQAPIKAYVVNQELLVNTPVVEGTIFISLFDLTGKKVMVDSFFGQSYRHDLSQLNAGIYILDLRGSQFVQRVKILIP